MIEPDQHAPLEIEDTPCDVTDEDMRSMDNPTSKVWKRVAPEDHERVSAELRAEADKY